MDVQRIKYRCNAHPGSDISRCGRPGPSALGAAGKSLLDIRGGDLSTLIGRRGETLDGLQYLMRLLVAKELGHYLHIVLDVEGYKAHRAQMLKQLALRMAERVTTTHKPAALEPMPANERRIVHLALRDHEQVRTESVGLGENRKVTIIPQSYKR